MIGPHVHMGPIKTLEVYEPLYYSWPLANSVTFHIYDHDTISIAPYFVRRFPYAGDS